MKSAVILPIFWIEAILTGYQGVWMMLHPSSWLRTILGLDKEVSLTCPPPEGIRHAKNTPSPSELMMELFRWGGVMYVLFGVILSWALFILRKEPSITNAANMQWFSMLLKMLAIGDILQVAVCAQLAYVAGVWSQNNIITVVVSLFFFCSRMVWLHRAENERKDVKATFTSQKAE